MPEVGMQRTDKALIGDTRATAVLTSRWLLETAEDQLKAGLAALDAMPAAEGLLRYSLFRGLDEPALFHLSQWSGKADRDRYVDGAASTARKKVDKEIPHLTRAWRIVGTPVEAYVADTIGKSSCVVVVRQPLVESNSTIARSWVDSVIRALRSPGGAPEGLRAAHFFAADGGGAVINIAEWVSAEAHRKALRPADFAQHGSLGDSPEWRAVRAHPGITPDHEVARYELLGVVEPV